ncbi:hypothetical protein HMPREF1549_00977 [Actinomyces johnsonii F0510]|uniref:Uncharacterized protein n=1 Tax=Actinomyces johnsonii F0510 TaxID=1227262 RepID=U1QG86_9ACTO|nr:hypothetical protein HMPREF1549_00977 [Actinomyces johnsonii F0510]
MPFLRRYGFSTVYNGGAEPEKSRGRPRGGETQEAPTSDKDHSVGAGVNGPIMASVVIWP